MCIITINIIFLYEVILTLHVEGKKVICVYFFVKELMHKVPNKSSPAASVLVI